MHKLPIADRMPGDSAEQRPRGRYARGCRIDSEDEIIGVLRLCYDSLYECGAQMIADGRLLDILRRAYTFGLTLFKLDIRQDSTRHSETLASICDALDLGNYLDWSEEEKCTWLVPPSSITPPRSTRRRALCIACALPPVFIHASQDAPVRLPWAPWHAAPPAIHHVSGFAQRPLHREDKHASKSAHNRARAARRLGCLPTYCLALVTTTPPQQRRPLPAHRGPDGGATSADRRAREQAAAHPAGHRAAAGAAGGACHLPDNRPPRLQRARCVRHLHGQLALRRPGRGPPTEGSPVNDPPGRAPPPPRCRLGRFRFSLLFTDCFYCLLVYSPLQLRL